MGKPVFYCGDAMDCCGGAEYPACQQNVETAEVQVMRGAVLRIDTTPCHYSDDQPNNTPYLCTD